ncbi:unnamed protein product [Closterium sp. NIES-54]
MRRCSGSGVLVPLFAIRPRTSSPLMLSPASSLALSLTRLAGSFTTPPRTVSSRLRTSRSTSRTSGGATSGGAEPGGAGSEDVGSGGSEPGDEEPGGAEPEGVELGGAESEGAESGGAEPRGATLFRDAGGGGAGVTAGASGPGGTAAAGPGGARTRGTGAAGTGGVGGAGAGDPTEPEAAGAGGSCAGGAGVGGTSSGGAGAAGARAVDPGAGGAGGTVRPRPYFIPLLQQVLVAATVTTSCTTCHAPRSRPPPVLGTHAMALRPSSVPLRVPLPAPLESSLPKVPDPKSDRARAASPTVSRLLATAVTDPIFESTAASALVAKLLDFAAACRLDYATALVYESTSASPPSVGGECVLGTDVLEDKQEDFECLAAAVPRFASMLLAPEGDPDAPDIPTPRSYAEAITGP